MYLLYSLLYIIWIALMMPYFLYAAWRYGKYVTGLGQRLGRLPETLKSNGKPTIWIHACSVGETLSAQPLARALRDRFPQSRFLFSTITITGQAIARDRFSCYGQGNTFYLPLDFVTVVRRVLNWIQPTMLITVDTEIWPNLLNQVKRRGIPVVMVNGRISPESFPRYRLIRRWLRKVLLHYDLMLMKSREDADRILQLGAPPSRVQIGGNIKHDRELVERQLSAKQAHLLNEVFGLAAHQAPLIVAGSTHQGEEEILLDVLASIRRKPALEETRLLLVPRHPERFDPVANLAERKGFRVKRRSEGPPWKKSAEVLLLDTMGELATAYQFATVVFVGGTLIPHGGQNVMEPALYAKPIVIGPSMENFPDVTAEFLAAKALVQIGADHTRKEAQRRQLSEALILLLEDDRTRRRLGQAARSVLEASKGATRASVEKIAGIYERALARRG